MKQEKQGTPPPAINQTTNYGHNINGNNNTINGVDINQIAGLQQQINELNLKLDLILKTLRNKTK